MGKTKDIVWKYCISKGNNIYQCMYCSKTFFKNASRMKAHLSKVCKNSPKQIKRKFMQRDEEGNASSSDNDNECVLVNESILNDNSTVIASELEGPVPEIPQPQPPTSSITAACSSSTIKSSSTDTDLEMPLASTSSVVNETIKPATSLMKPAPATSRKVFEFADRISKKDQVSVVDYC